MLSQLCKSVGIFLPGFILFCCCLVKQNPGPRPGCPVAFRDDAIYGWIGANPVLLARHVVLDAVAEVLAHLEVAGDAAIDAAICEAN
jgi:hypothetical protein